MKKNYLAILIGALILVTLISFFPRNILNVNKKSQKLSQQSSLVKKKKHKTNSKILPFKDPKDLVKEGNWQQKSEEKKHPNLKKVKKLWVRVSLKGNRTYVMSKNKPIYTMLSTGGIYLKGKSLTPTGTFKVEEERGKYFFNPELNEGAKNFVSWKNHGIYLFHSVPTKADSAIDRNEAKKLGRAQGSHGCIRLSIPDSEYFSKNLPVGTKVVIANN